MAGKIGENLLTAMSTVLTGEIRNLRFDKTVPAVIRKVVDASKGEYRIQYEGNIVTAYSNDTSVVYNKDDTVLVKIPEGDLSNRKTIEGYAERGVSYSEYNDLANYVAEAGPHFNDIYSFMGEWGLTAGPSPTVTQQRTIYLDPNGEDYDTGLHSQFAFYGKKYNKIRISGEFRTELNGRHDKGDYGVRVVFWTQVQGKNNSVSFVPSEPVILDLEDFTGSLYNYPEYSYQYTDVGIMEGSLVGIKEITFFQKDFDFDSWIASEYDSQTGTFTPKNVTNESDNTPNLFVRNADVQFLEVLDLTQYTYYLHMTAPEGNAVSSSKLKLSTLVGKLLYKGQDVSENGEDKDFRWYEKDTRISPTSEEGYDEYGGEGWRYLGDYKTNTLPIAPPGYTGTPPYETINYYREYKLVVVINDKSENKTVVRGTIEAFNITASYAFSIEQKTNQEHIYLSIKNTIGQEPQNLRGEWFYKLDSGSRVFFELGDADDPQGRWIDITNYVQYQNIIFYCAVYDGPDDETNYITTLEKQLVNTESQQDISVVFEGRRRYHYDADGNINVEDKETEKLLLANIQLKDGVMMHYNLVWKLPDGTVIPVDKANAVAGGMLTGVYVDGQGVVHYSILPKYNNSRAQDHIITLEVIADNGTVYSFPFEMIFTKDGDVGTNGTRYGVEIRPVSDDSGSQRLYGFQPFIKDNGVWVRPAANANYYVKAFVYKDGEELVNGNNYNITYDWTLSEGLVGVGSLASPIVRLAPPSIDKQYYYLRLRVNIRDNQNSTSTQIYGIYGIGIWNNSNEFTINKLNELKIPAHIMYSTSGANPSYVRDPLVVEYNGTRQEDKLQVGDNYTKYLSIDALTHEGVTNYYLRPSYYYIGGDSNKDQFPFVYFNNGDGGYFNYPIITYLNTYGNEAINGWDGSVLEIDEDGRYILAPQIGAGVKNNDNTFTGVVMGKDSQETEIGLYGYQAGVNTFGLKANGTAYFGRADKGRISIDGTNTVIYGGRTKGQSNSMVLTLQNTNSDEGIDSTSVKAIEIKNSSGNSAFYVNYNGKLYANNVEVTGEIYSGSGNIGGWKINSNSLSNSNSTVVLRANPGTNEYHINGASINITDNGENVFTVTKEGEATLEEGRVGGWYFSKSGSFLEDGSLASWKGGESAAGAYMVIHPAGDIEAGSGSTRRWSILNYGGSSSDTWNSIASFNRIKLMGAGNPSYSGTLVGWRVYTRGDMYTGVSIDDEDLNSPPSGRKVVVWDDLDTAVADMKDYVDSKYTQWFTAGVQSSDAQAYWKDYWLDQCPA